MVERKGWYDMSQGKKYTICYQGRMLLYAAREGWFGMLSENLDTICFQKMLKREGDTIYYYGKRYDMLPWKAKQYVTMDG